jgi:tripartite-type tricarboxylate transporter receptor subunit TctC
VIRFSLLVTAVAALSAPVADVLAQIQSGRPMRLVVPQAPGGTNDTLARIVADRLSERLGGTQIVVDNRPGGNAQIGSSIVARADPDGRTLLISGAGHAISPALDHKLPYDTERDFAPVGLVGGGPYLLVIHPSVTAHTTKEFVAWVKARPGQVNYASAGIGNPTHLAAELFNHAAGIDMRHIPYKGGAAVLPDLIAGRVTAFFSSITTAQTHVAAGRLRPVAVTTAKRSPFAPEVPTLAESGVKGAEVDAWYGILTTGRTPRAAVDNLAAALRQVLRDPATREVIQKQGITPSVNTPEEFAALIKSDIAKWTKVVRAAGIKAE